MRIFRNKFHIWEYRTCYITDVAEAVSAVASLDLSKVIGLDIETAKLPEWVTHEQAGLCPLLSRIRLLQFYSAGIVYVFDLFSIPLETFRDVLMKGRFVAHNGIFEIQHLTHAGFPGMNVGCSMLLSQLVDGAEHFTYEVEDDEDDDDHTGLARYRRRSHGLDAVTQRLFGAKVDKTQQTSDWGAEVLTEDQIVYAGLDAVLTVEAAKVLAVKLREYKMEKAYVLDKDIQHVVAHMQLQGLPVDWEYHAKLMKEWEAANAAALEACHPFFGEVNMRSGKQMNAWLLEYLKDQPLILDSWPHTMKKGYPDSVYDKSRPYAFGKEILPKYTHLPAIAALVEYRKWSKLLSTYGQSLLDKKHPITGRLHTSYTLGATTTGRFASRAPNCQNFPNDKKFRDIFAVKGADKQIVVSDLSQIETRLQAEFSQDPVMLEAFRSKEDIYCKLATSIYGHTVTKSKAHEPKRKVGKTCVLALGYGMGAPKLAHRGFLAGINQPTIFWKQAWDTYYSTFSVYTRWCSKMRDRAEKLGYIETLLGKRRKLSEQELYTCAPNTVIQGTAAELMKKAMLLCFRRMGTLATMVATVHDEILLVTSFENRDTVKTILASSMNDAMKEMFPSAVTHEVADASSGFRWGQAKAEL